jgi:carbon storage regulator
MAVTSYASQKLNQNRNKLNLIWQRVVVFGVPIFLHGGEAMLILSRKCGERVVISLNGETVMIEIMKIRGSQVRVGIQAPVHVAVHREEVWSKLTTEQVAHRLMPIAG